MKLCVPWGCLHPCGGGTEWVDNLLVPAECGVLEDGVSHCLVSQ